MPAHATHYLPTHLRYVQPQANGEDRKGGRVRIAAAWPRVVTLTLPCPPAARSAAVTVSLICVALTYVVGRFDPFHCACESGIKFSPSTTRVIAAALAASVMIWPGEIAVIEGVGFWPGAAMSNVAALDVPPPGPGSTTTTPACPGCAISATLICVVSLVLLTKLVGRFARFHCTAELLMKPLPLTVSVNAAPPADADAGPSVSIAGTGFSFGAVIVNLTALEVPPPGAGFATVTSTWPALVISLAAIIVVSCVLLTNVVVCALGPIEITAPGTKLAPFTISLNALLPAAADAGESDISAGMGFAICSATTWLSL